MTGLFFTGTDTGCGKTFVTSAVVRELRRTGRAVSVCKPVATGAAFDAGTGGWVADDTRTLAEAAGVAPNWHAVTGWTFEEPLAPPVAARRAGVRLTLAGIETAVRDRYQAGTTAVVEGIGGLLCPLTDDATVADLIARLGLPVVIVTRRALGTLNHTLLTLEVARGRGLAVAGVVVTETHPPAGPAEETNVDELRRLGAPVLAVVPFTDAAGRFVPADEPELDAVAWERLADHLLP